MALGEGPLRTKGLTEQVPGYASRTVYRYAGGLAELGVIEREEEPGVPSKVVHRLTDPFGIELYDLITRFADSTLIRLPDGRIDAHAWMAMGLLADLWDTGMIEELSYEGRSPTELARGPHGLSYHQVNRRAGLFKESGLLCEWHGPGRRHSYGLTEKTRRKMGLIAGVARWRYRHLLRGDEEGITGGEMATLLRTALPLVKVPEHSGRSLRLEVPARGEGNGAKSDAVWAGVEGDGTVRPCVSAPASADGWGRGEVREWIPTVLDGKPQGIMVGGDEVFVGDCLNGLYSALWAPSSF
jgi:DNA-binding HxlR family transcriptional regulator